MIGYLETLYQMNQYDTVPGIPAYVYYWLPIIGTIISSVAVIILLALAAYALPVVRRAKKVIPDDEDLSGLDEFDSDTPCECRVKDGLCGQKPTNWANRCEDHAYGCP